MQWLKSLSRAIIHDGKGARTDVESCRLDDPQPAVTNSDCASHFHTTSGAPSRPRISLDLAAAIIGHDAGEKAVQTLVRHYIRTDQIEQKKVVLSAWDARLQRIIAGKAEAQNVLPFVRVLLFEPTQRRRRSGSAPRSGRGGRRFKSCHSDQSFPSQINHL